MRVGYILRRYPRLRDPHVVEEILAHERAGIEVEIISLRAPRESHFDDAISRVRAPVSFLATGDMKALRFWDELRSGKSELPELESTLDACLQEDSADVHQALDLARAVRSRGITHLHAHACYPAATVARMAARIAGISFSLTSYASDLADEESAGDVSGIFRDATGVVAVSKPHCQELRARYPLLDHKIDRIPVSFDVNRAVYRSPLQRPPDIVSVGSPSEERGFHVLLECLSILDCAGVKFHCSLIGAEYDADLERRILALGISRRVETFWTRSQSFIREKVLSAAVLTAPGLSREGAPRDVPCADLLHAMACGTPCVATAAENAGEPVREAETGLLVDEQDPSSLASALIRVLGDPAERVRVSRRARRHIEEEFDADTNAARLRNVFGSSAGGAGNPTLSACA